MIWRLAVLGSPIEHSVSPQLHEAGLKYLGFEGTSQRVQIDQAHAARIGEVMGDRYDAVSLTMPLKEVAAGMCDQLDETAARLGVVNSLLWRESKLWGASTDGAGFIDSLRAEFSFSVAHTHVVVLGSGGAARGIVEALVGEGASSITVIGRNASSVASLVSRHPSVGDHSLIYRPVDLIVNTTPSSGRLDASAVMQGVSRETIAVDITYAPRVSPWLARHAELGCPHANGLAMLANTVARQMNWWWDSDIPGRYLMPTLREALA